MGEHSNTDELVILTTDGSERHVYPEVAEFFNSRRQADIDCRLTQLKAAQEYAAMDYTKQIEAIEAGNLIYDSYGAMQEMRRAQRDINNAAQNALAATNRDSWTLLTQSPHKEVAWIAEHCREYEHEAMTILRYLPATLDELWDVAKNDHEMCNVFDRFAEQAERAGLFTQSESQLPAVLKARRELKSRMRSEYGSGYARAILPMVEPYVKVSVESALANARAEWQKLDEAQAENVHRNRSAGARQAAETRRANAEAAALAAQSADVASVPEAEDIHNALKEEINA